ncbi:MAG: hypothetical protein ABW073_10395 [Acidimicrobiia bacterium]
MNRRRATRQSRRAWADSNGRTPGLDAARRDVGWDWTRHVAPLDPDVGSEMLDHPDAAIAPPEYEPVRRVLSAAAAPARPAELAGDVIAAAEFVTARSATLSGVSALHATRPHRHLRLVAVTTITLVLCTGTAVAATNGALPTPVQSLAHETLGVVGVTIPESDDANDNSGSTVVVDTPTSGAAVAGGRTNGASAAGSSTTTVTGRDASAGTPSSDDAGNGNGNGNGNGDVGNGGAAPDDETTPADTDPTRGNSANAPGQNKPANTKKANGNGPNS